MQICALPSYCGQENANWHTDSCKPRVRDPKSENKGDCCPVLAKNSLNIEMSQAWDHETSAQFTAAAGGLTDGLNGGLLPPIRKSGLDDPGDSLGGLAGN